jgi:hypothetical protein
MARVKAGYLALGPEKLIDYPLGQPRKAFQRINRYVRQRLYQR